MSNNPSEKAWNLIIEKINKLRFQDGMTLEKIGKICGVNKVTVHHWLNNRGQGERTSFNNMLQYIRGLDIPLEEAIGFNPIDDSDYGYVPHVRAKLGAGYSLETSNEVNGLLAFRKKFLAQVGPTSRLILFDVQGTSMEPTIHDGDTVLINTGETDIRSGELYAIRIGDEISIKRLERMPGRVMVKSDNPQHHSFEVNLTEIDSDFAIIGRVRWLGRVI